MTELKDTVYNVSSICNRMRKGTKRTDLHMFANGAHQAINPSQLKEMEGIIDNDYRAAKEVIKYARKKNQFMKLIAHSLLIAYAIIIGTLLVVFSASVWVGVAWLVVEWLK